MKPLEHGQESSASRKCPKCDTELVASILGGQCPSCVVQLIRQPIGEEDQTVSNEGFDSHSSTETKATTVDRRAARYFGEYELLGEIGRGGMGVVYRARQLNLNRIVALKLIATAQLASPKAIERFRTEAEAAANLDHPNIVPIHETGECDGRHYFSMKLIEGPSLAQRIADFGLQTADFKTAQSKAFPPSCGEGRSEGERSAYPKSAIRHRQFAIATLLAKVADAVHYAHQRGILHRDLKPGNILVDASGEPHVADFGLAKHFQIESSLTLSGEVLGTPAYMAPEQAAGKTSEMTTATDVYSLGVILYELLTGRPPFRGGTPVDTLQAVMHREAASPCSINPAVPRDLETICLKCLEKQPGKRYESAQEFGQELRRFARGEPIRARAVTKPEKVWRWCRRNPALAGALGAAVLALAIGLGGVIWQWRRAENSAAESRQRELTARENLYAADINQIEQALAADNLRQARGLLQKQIPKAGEPDLRGFEWRYLWRQCQSEELLSLPSHEGAAVSVAFSSDGKMLATGSWDKTVKIWNLASRQAIATLSVTDWVQSVTFSPHGDLIATAASSGATAESKTCVRLWDAKSFQPIQTFEQQRAVKVRFSPDGRYLVAGGTNLALWETRSGKMVNGLDLLADVTDHGPDGLQFGLAFAPDGQRVAVVLNEGVKLISVPEIKEAGVLKDKMPGFRFAAFSPDGRILVTCTAGNNVKLWDVASQQELKLLSAPDTFSATFSPDGKRLATCNAGQTIELWDVASGKPIRKFKGHTDEVWDLAFSPDGKSIASVSKDGAVKLWDASADLMETTELRGILPLGFRSDGDLLGFTTNGLLITFEPETLRKISNQGFRGHGGRSGFIVSLGNLSSDGQTVAVPFDNAKLEVFDLSQGRFLSSVENVDECVAFAPKKQLVATTTSNRTVTIWQMPGGVPKFVLTNASPPLAISPDETILATSLEEGPDLTLWKLEGDRALRQATVKTSGWRGGRGALAFSPDGRLLARSTFQGFIHLLEMPSGKEIATLVGHKSVVPWVAFNPDGKTLASISEDSARLWHVASGRQLMSFRISAGQHPQIAFSRDGRTLVSKTQQSESYKTEDAGGPTASVWYAPSFAEIAIAEGKDYTSALTVDPAGWLAAGKALAKRNRDAEALRAFAEVIQRSSGRPDLKSLRTSAFNYRSPLLRKLGKFAEAGADNCAALNVPSRDPRTLTTCIDLSLWFNRSLDSESPSIPPSPFLEALPEGLHILPGTGDVEFDLRGVVQLTHHVENPSAPSVAEGIQVRQTCKRLHFLESAHFRETEDTPVGAYVIHYANGTQEEIPILYGRHVRDWVLTVDPDALGGAKIAWTGPNSAKGTIRIFEQLWENPHPEVEIQTLDFVSKMTKCAPFLIAVTAEP